MAERAKPRVVCPKCSGSRLGPERVVKETRLERVVSQPLCRICKGKGYITRGVVTLLLAAFAVACGSGGPDCPSDAEPLSVREREVYERASATMGIEAEEEPRIVRRPAVPCPHFENGPPWCVPGWDAGGVYLDECKVMIVPLPPADTWFVVWHESGHHLLAEEGVPSGEHHCDPRFVRIDRKACAESRDGDS
jgi:hypothetical protein